MMKFYIKEVRAMEPENLMLTAKRFESEFASAHTQAKLISID